MKRSEKEALKYQETSGAQRALPGIEQVHSLMDEGEMMKKHSNVKNLHLGSELVADFSLLIDVAILEQVSFQNCHLKMM